MSDEKNKKQQHRKDYQKQYKKEYATYNTRVSMTLTKSEMALLKSEAEEIGWKPGTLAREIVLSRIMDKPIITKELNEKISTLSFLMANIATNVNQIAKHSNSVKRLIDERGLMAELSKLSKSVTEFIHKNSKWYTSIKYYKKFMDGNIESLIESIKSISKKINDIAKSANQFKKLPCEKVLFKNLFTLYHLINIFSKC